MNNFLKNMSDNNEVNLVFNQGKATGFVKTAVNGNSSILTYIINDNPNWKFIRITPFSTLPNRKCWFLFFIGFSKYSNFINLYAFSPPTMRAISIECLNFIKKCVVNFIFNNISKEYSSPTTCIKS